MMTLSSDPSSRIMKSRIPTQHIILICPSLRTVFS
jgi:hypothetical protein